MTVVVSDVVIVRSIFFFFFINFFHLGHARYSKAYGPLLIHPVTNNKPNYPSPPNYPLYNPSSRAVQ